MWSCTCFICCHDPVGWAGRGFSCIFPEQNQDWGEGGQWLLPAPCLFPALPWVLGKGPANFIALILSFVWVIGREVSAQRKAALCRQSGVSLWLLMPHSQSPMATWEYLLSLCRQTFKDLRLRPASPSFYPGKRLPSPLVELTSHGELGERLGFGMT